MCLPYNFTTWCSNFLCPLLVKNTSLTPVSRSPPSYTRPDPSLKHSGYAFSPHFSSEVITRTTCPATRTFVPGLYNYFPQRSRRPVFDNKTPTTRRRLLSSSVVQWYTWYFPRLTCIINNIIVN